MSRTVVALVALCVALALGAAPPAGAQTVTDLADQLDARGYATGPAADVDVNDLEELADRLDDDRVVVVALAEPWTSGNDLLAVDLVETIEDERTVLVHAPVGDGTVELGAASAVVDDDAIDEGLDAAFDQSARDVISMADAFAAGLGDSGSGGGSVLGPATVVVVVVVAVVGLLWFLSKRNDKKTTDRVTAAREELRGDIAAVANDILALGDRIELSDDTEAAEHYRKGNLLYLDVDRAFASATTFDAVDDLDDELEIAAWHLDVAEALLDGTEPPPEPDTTEPWEGDDRPAASTLPDGAIGARAPTPPPPPRPAPSSRSTSRSGGMSGVLGGILGEILVGGGGRRHGRRGYGGLRTRPRRTRRTSSPSRRRPSSRRRSSRGRGRRRG